MTANGSERANPYRNFIDELKRLHFYAGRPSPSELARQARARGSNVRQADIARALRWPANPVRKMIGSQTTERLPRWEVTEILVRMLNGDLRHFRTLWTAAEAQITRELEPGQPVPVPAVDPAPREAPATPPTPPALPPGAAAPVAGKDLQVIGPWGRLNHDEYSAPTAIRLMEAAVRDGRDAADLLVQISCADPVGAAPALAMVCEYHPEWAGEVLAMVTERNSAGVPLLLREIARTNPRQAAALTSSLLDSAKAGPASLFDVAVHLAGRLPEQRPLVCRVLMRAHDEGRVPEAAAQLAAAITEDSGAIPTIAGALEIFFANPSTRRLGLQTLAWLAKTDQVAAAEVFLHVICDPARKDRMRRAPDNGLLFAIIARQYSTGCAYLLLTYALRGKDAIRHTPATARRLGILLLHLGAEDPAAAAVVLAKMIRSSAGTVMAILGSAPGSNVGETARLLIAVSKADTVLAAQVVARWIGQTYPAYPIPAGWLVEEMVAEDAVVATLVLAQAATDFSDPMPLAGLDQKRRRQLFDGIRVHATSEQWGLIKRAFAGGSAGILGQLGDWWGGPSTGNPRAGS